MRAVAPAGPGVPRAVTHGAQATSMEAWLDLVVAEDDWVRREFEEIVAAGWGGEGPSAPPTARGGGRPRRARRSRHGWLESDPRTSVPPPAAEVRGRGPPPARRASPRPRCAGHRCWTLTAKVTGPKGSRRSADAGRRTLRDRVMTRHPTSPAPWRRTDFRGPGRCRHRRRRWRRPSGHPRPARRRCRE